MDDLEELRRLLLKPEQDQLRELHEQAEDQEKRAHDVSDVLAQAVKLSRGRGEELSRALQPAVESSIKESIETKPEVFVDALHPIIGQVVRRSIAESLRGLLQSMNQTMEHTFSLQGLKWRLEGIRTGRSFAEVVMLRSLVYRVEQLFLIHRETGLALLHVSADTDLVKDSDLVAGMLSAIQDFARDSFKIGEESALEEFRVGELEVWVVPGRQAFLAAAIRGNAPRELYRALEEAIGSVHILKGSALTKFEGDASVFESLRPDLEPCLRAQYRASGNGGGRYTKAWVMFGAAAILIIAGLVFAVQREVRWRGFVRRLNAQPGIAVTLANHGWLFHSRIEGLRDPDAADPLEVAREAGIGTGRVEFQWKDYISIDAESVRRRFVKRFAPRQGTEFGVKSNAALEIAGSVPYEWLEQVRRDARFVPGISAVVEKDLAVTYDPALTLQRFRVTYPLPQGTSAIVKDGMLFLKGQAPYEWLVQVREGAGRIPGIKTVSEKEVKPLFNPALVLRRFEDRFPLPDSVTAQMHDGVLALSGEVSHGWLDRVRRGAPEMPGITSLDESKLTDIDQRAFQQAKSVIESAFVYFLTNRDNFDTSGFAALSRLPDQIRLCQTAARHLGDQIVVEVLGSADASGRLEKNLDLKRRRAEAVQNFLVSCGLDAELLRPVAHDVSGVPEAPGSADADRRVGFRVVSQASTTKL